MQKTNRYCSIIIYFVSLTLLLCYIECGPARSLALASVQRGSKIPRSIRAPFRNTEIMTARGFGKRASTTTTSGLNLMKSSNQNLENGNSGWINYYGNGNRHEMKYYDDLNNDNLVNENFEEIFNEQGNERYNMLIPIDWLVGELASNPGLLRAILYRFVDANKDGLLSMHEIMTPSSSLSSSSSSSSTSAASDIY